MCLNVGLEAVREASSRRDDEARFIAALRAGDESAFVVLIDRYHAAMLRLAQMFVQDAAVAEEVVQEAWLGVLRGLGHFEARCSLKHWISTIVVNRARTRATRERRSVPRWPRCSNGPRSCRRSPMHRINGGDDFLGSSRERLFAFVNGQTGANNNQTQGFRHLVLDGHAAEDASADNAALINALRNGGDLPERIR